MSPSLLVICVWSVCPVVIKLAVLLSELVLRTPVAVLRAVISASLSVIKPDTVFISVVRDWPVVIKLLVRLVISESFDVICVCRVWPVVPIFVVSVDISPSLEVICVCSVCPVVTKLLVRVVISPSLDVIWVWSVCPVVIRLVVFASVLVFKTPVALFKAVMSASLSVIKPDTVLISLVNVWPVVIRLDVKVLMSESLLVIWVWSVWPVVPKLVVRVEISPSFDVIWVCKVWPVVIKLAALLSVLVLRTPVAVFKAVMSPSLSTINPETVVMSVVKVCPVVTRLEVRLVISESFEVIWVCNVWPVVIKFPLNVSTLPLKASSLAFSAIPETIAISEVKVWPVVTKFEVRVDISESLLVICVCSVCPVVAKLDVIVEISESLLVIWVCRVCPVTPKLLVRVDISESFDVICVCRVWPVVIKFPLNVSTLPLKAGSELDPVAKPETIAMSDAKVCPVVIKLPLKVLTLPLKAVTSWPPAIPETIAISLFKKLPVEIKLTESVSIKLFNVPVAVCKFDISPSFWITKPETIAISESIRFPVVIKFPLKMSTKFPVWTNKLVSVWPVVLRFPLKSEISLSLEVIWLWRVCPVVIKLPLSSLKSWAEPPVAIPETIAISACKFCPVVIKFPLTSSTIRPVETRLDETVFILVSNKPPVEFILLWFSNMPLSLLVIWVWSVWPVVTKLPLSSSKGWLISPETVRISAVKVWPVVAKLLLTVDTSELILFVRVWPVVIKFVSTDWRLFKLEVIWDCKVWPVVPTFVDILLTWVWRLAPVVIKLPLIESTIEPVDKKDWSVVPDKESILFVKVVPVLPKLETTESTLPSTVLIWPSKVLPVSVSFACVINEPVTPCVTTGLPWIATGKLNSNLSFSSLNKISASVRDPLSMIKPPVIRDIPAPVSPVFKVIVLSFTARCSTSIIVSDPVTVKFLIVTSLKIVWPVADWKSIPPFEECIGTSPINNVLLDIVMSWKWPLKKGSSGVPIDSEPLALGTILPEIVPPILSNLFNCKSPVESSRRAMSTSLLLIWFCKFCPVSRRFPLSISLKESRELPVAIKSPLKLFIVKFNWFPVEMRTPLKTPISSVRVVPVTIKLARRLATSFVRESISPWVAKMSVLTPKSGTWPLTFVTGASPATVVTPSTRLSTTVVVDPLTMTSTTVWVLILGSYLRVN